MYLGVYHFTGDPAALTASYDKLREQFGGQVLLNLCVVRADGIAVYDACPSRADFVSFSTGTFFADALERVGLPTPTVEHVGDVHAYTSTAAPVG